MNLAGENILDPRHRWTTEFKQAVWMSRIQTTESLVKAMVRAKAKPEVFVSTSAIGQYSFLSLICGSCTATKIWP